MKQAGCARWQFLKLGISVPIKPGDVCSLLPDKCWFKVISVPDMEKNDQILKRKADENLSNNADSKKACLASNVEIIVSPSETLNDMLSDKDPLSEHQNSINENSEPNDDTAPILQEINSTSSLRGNSMPATCSKMLTDSQDIIDRQQNDKKQTVKNINSTNEAMTNVEAGKKIKWDCDAHFSDQTENVTECVQVLSTQNNAHSPVATHQDKTNARNPVKVIREKCMYGARCYRKNPNHKNNYSHPADSDYDKIDNRKECPYGKKCYRKNPQHKMHFKHTSIPRHRRRAATPMHSAINTTSETDHSSAEESIDESDYEPSVYTESSDELESTSEWEDGTTG